MSAATPDPGSPTGAAPVAAPASGDACLLTNLAAIAERDPSLAARLTLPVRDDHVRAAPDGRSSYRYRGEWLPLDLDAAQVARALRPVSEVGGRDGVLVFGLGLGETLVAAARGFAGAPLTAWERDPWLLRLFLSRVDCADVIRAGRLRFTLGADLIDLAGQAPASSLVVHPLLGRVYRAELRALENGLGPRRAMVCTGELFVDDVVEALGADGWDVLLLDTELLSLEELAYGLRRVRPRFLLAVNYREGLVELCHAAGVPLVSWEIDPTTDGVPAPAAPTDAAHVFTYRRAQVAAFAAAGFRDARYLPLAANPQRRRPLTLPPAEVERYGAAVSFVGASMAAPAARYRERFLSIVECGEGGTPAAARRAVAARLDEVLAAQRADFAVWRVPTLLAAAFPDLRADFVAAGAVEDPALLVGELAAAEKRRAYVAALAPLGVDVWGDDGWADLDRPGLRYRGRAGHLVELTKIYGATRVNVDVGRLYQTDIVPMRVFDVLACGAFVLAEHCDALAELFAVGREVESYRTVEELVDKARWYAVRPQAAAAVAARGLAKVRAAHTIAARVREMLAAAGLER
jgi:spore maturation protein CgeB